MLKKILYFYLLSMMLIFQNVMATKSNILYYQSFDNENESFESPCITSDLAFKNKSAMILAQNGTFQSINVYPNINIEDHFDLKFYWRYNISSNYTIGFFIKFIFEGQSNIIDITLSNNGTLFIPLSVNKYYKKDDFYHSSVENEWNEFSIFDIKGFINDSINVESSSIKIEQITFFLVNSNKTGYLMIDEISINNKIESLKNIDNNKINYFYVTISIIVIIMVSMLMISKKLKNR